jgi:hypothetical protein
VDAENAMRFNLRLNGRTDSNQECRADVSVYAGSQQELQEQATKAAENAVWLFKAAPHDPIPEGSHITIESVEQI